MIINTLYYKNFRCYREDSFILNTSPFSVSWEGNAIINLAFYLLGPLKFIYTHTHTLPHTQKHKIHIWTQYHSVYFALYIKSTTDLGYLYTENLHQYFLHFIVWIYCSLLCDSSIDEHSEFPPTKCVSITYNASLNVLECVPLWIGQVFLW